MTHTLKNVFIMVLLVVVTALATTLYHGQEANAEAVVEESCEETSSCTVVNAPNWSAY
jgi:hypothetical protein